MLETSNKKQTRQFSVAVGILLSTLGYMASFIQSQSGTRSCVDLKEIRYYL